jgi:hypothetical protein
MMREVTRSSETSVLTGVTRHNIPGDGILHSHRRENLKHYIALTAWTIPEEGILQNHRPENLKSYMGLTGWTLFLVRYKLRFYFPEDGFFIVAAVKTIPEEGILHITALKPSNIT